MTVHNTNIYREQGGDNLVVESSAKAGKIGGVSYTIGAEDTNAITVNVQLQKADSAASDIDFSACVLMFLSDDSGGVGVSGTAPDTSVAAGTDGALIVEHTADLVWTAQSESDGDIDIVITETGADTWYLVTVLPDGSQVVSDAITFAA